MIFDPTRFLKTVLPKSFYTRHLYDVDNGKRKQTQIKYIIAALMRNDAVETRKTDLNKTIHKAIDIYKNPHNGSDNDSMLKQHIENLLVYDKVQEIKDEHKGQYYQWIPSDAQYPDPEHMLLYGKVFKVGEGDDEDNMPGERYGCRCAAKFIEDDSIGAFTVSRSIVSVAAENALNHAKEVEPFLTEAIKDVIDTIPGTQLVKLATNIKSKKSIAQKLKRLKQSYPYTDKGYKEIASNLYDINRYTQSSSNIDDLMENYQKTLRAFKEKKYEVKNIRNFFTGKTNNRNTHLDRYSYRGINVEMTNPKGNKFEIQFNTSKNIAINAQTHKYYKISVDQNAADWKKRSADNIMRVITKGYELPNIGEYFD